MGCTVSPTAWGSHLEAIIIPVPNATPTSSSDSKSSPTPISAAEGISDFASGTGAVGAAAAAILSAAGSSSLARNLDGVTPAFAPFLSAIATLFFTGSFIGLLHVFPREFSSLNLARSGGSKPRFEHIACRWVARRAVTPRFKIPSAFLETSTSKRQPRSISARIRPGKRANSMRPKAPADTKWIHSNCGRSRTTMIASHVQKIAQRISLARGGRNDEIRSARPPALGLREGSLGGEGSRCASTETVRARQRKRFEKARPEQKQLIAES